MLVNAVRIQAMDDNAFDERTATDVTPLLVSTGRRKRWAVLYKKEPEHAVHPRMALLWLFSDAPPPFLHHQRDPEDELHHFLLTSGGGRWST